MQPGIERFLDEEGRLKQLPAKRAPHMAALEYLAGKLEPEREYSEREINAVLASWHTFGDHTLLRRELVDGGWLCRLRDGSKYWKNSEKKQEDA